MTRRTLLLTGATGGIGRAIARTFHDHGARLVLIDHDRAAVEALAAELGATAVVADARIPGESARAVADAVAAAGEIHDVVLAAGVYPEAPVAGLTLAEWSACLRINLDSAFETCQAVLPHLAENSSVVGLTSIAGQRGSAAHSHYAASKAGLLGFLRSFALEAAPRTRVNAVAPGTIATPMTAANRERFEDALLAATPLRRFGTPEEVAGVVRFLCSPEAGFITGEQIAVNGGMYMA